MLTWMSQYDFDNCLSREMMFFHDFLCMMLLFVAVFVGVMIIYVYKKISLQSIYLEGKKLETLWTLGPMSILGFVFYPSIYLLNFSNVSSMSSENFTDIIKVIGHQWYWEYRYNFLEEMLNYDSYPGEDNFMRCYSTSSVLLINSENMSELQVTSDDVIHSFSLPSLGMKMDAVPGRMKSKILEGFVNHFGLLSGQCSEICGVLHSNMPMLAFYVPYSMFL